MNIVNRTVRGLAAAALFCVLVAPLSPRPAEAQNGSRRQYLLMPWSSVWPTLRLNVNVAVVNNLQIGRNNVAVIAVDQENVTVPRSGAGTVINLNRAIVNNVQIGRNNTAVITLNQSNRQRRP